MAGDAKRYRAFISYSQRDKRWAVKLHKALEAWRAPAGVSAPSLDAKTRKLGRFFRDDEEMGAVESLGAALQGAIDGSESLIVLCSPHSAKSKWVDLEVRRFKRRGGARVFAVIVGGTPNSNDPKTECFCPALKEKVGPDGELTGEPDEPLAPDWRKDGLERLKVRLAAGLLAAPFDDLWKREQRRAGAQARAVAAAVLVAAAGVAAGGWSLWRAQRGEIAARSSDFASRALIAADAGDSDSALIAAVAAYPVDETDARRAPSPQALAALRRAMALSGVERVARFEDLASDVMLAAGDAIAVETARDLVLLSAETGERFATLPGARVGEITDDGAALVQIQISEPETNRFTLKAAKRSLPDGALQHETAITLSGWSPYENARSPSGAVIGVVATVPPARLGFVDLFEGSGEVDPEGVAALPGGASPTEYRFDVADETTLVFTWPTASGEMGLGLLRRGEAPIVLADPEAPPLCAPPPGPARKPVDIDRLVSEVSMAADRSSVILWRSQPPEGWCAHQWSLPSGALSGEVLARSRGSGSVRPGASGSLIAPNGAYHANLTADATVVQPACVNDRPALRLLGSRIAATSDVAPPKAYGCVQDREIFVAAPAANAAGRWWRRPDFEGRAVAIDPARGRLLVAGAGPSGGEVIAVPFTQDMTIQEPLDDDLYAPSLIGAKGAVLAVWDDGETTAIDFRTKFSPSPNKIIADGGLNLRAFSAGDHLVLTWEQAARAFDQEPYVESGALLGLGIVVLDWRDGAVTARYDAIHPGWLDPREQRLAVLADVERIVFERPDGAVVWANLASGARLSERAWSRGDLVGLAPGPDATVWAASLIDDDAEKTILVDRVAVDGQAIEIDRVPAQAAHLFADGAGGVAIAFDQAHRTGGGAELRFYGADGAQRSAARLEAMPVFARFDPAGERLAVVAYGRPVRAYAAKDGAATTLSPTLEILGASEVFVEDPQARALAFVNDSKLRLIPWPGRSLCPALDGATAYDVAFSPDGALLAVQGEETLQIFDTVACTKIQEIEAPSYGYGQLAFSDSATLWTVWEDELVSIAIDDDLATLLERARARVQRLERPAVP